MEDIDQYLDSQRIEIVSDFETGTLTNEKGQDPNTTKKDITSDKKDETE